MSPSSLTSARPRCSPALHRATTGCASGATASRRSESPSPSAVRLVNSTTRAPSVAHHRSPSFSQLPTNAPTLLNGTPTPANIARRFKLNPVQGLPKGVELGMLGRVTVVLRDKKGVLMVKTTAVRSAGPRSFVQVIQGGRKRDVDVEIGIVTPTDTEIVKGLNEGDKVVDAPAAPAKPGVTPGTKP